MEDVVMRTFDYTPLWRSTVGFDRLFNMLDESMHWTGEESVVCSVVRRHHSRRPERGTVEPLGHPDWFA
jgi:hypothetical protein